jgi:hypothetical protein
MVSSCNFSCKCQLHRNQIRLRRVLCKLGLKLADKSDHTPEFHRGTRWRRNSQRCERRRTRRSQPASARSMETRKPYSSLRNKHAKNNQNQIKLQQKPLSYLEPNSSSMQKPIGGLSPQPLPELYKALLNKRAIITAEHNRQTKPLIISLTIITSEGKSQSLSISKPQKKLQ